MPAYPQPLADVIRVIDETFMANHDAFRLPGRPRCVDHVGQVLAQGPALRLALVLLADFLPLQIQTHSLSPMGRQTTLQLLRGYHHSDPGVLQHVAQPLQRVTGVQRQIGSPALSTPISAITISADLSRHKPTTTSGP